MHFSLKVHNITQNSDNRLEKSMNSNEIITKNAVAVEITKNFVEFIFQQ